MNTTFSVFFISFSFIILISTFLFTGSAAILIAFGFFFLQCFIKLVHELISCLQKNQVIRNRINSLKQKDGTVFESVAPTQENFEPDSSSIKND